MKIEKINDFRFEISNLVIIFRSYERSRLQDGEVIFLHKIIIEKSGSISGRLPLEVKASTENRVATIEEVEDIIIDNRRKITKLVFNGI